MAICHTDGLTQTEMTFPCCGSKQPLTLYMTSATKQTPGLITLAVECVENMDAVLERHRDVCPQLWPGDNSLA